MSRPWKIGIGIVTVVVVLNVLLAAIDSVTGGTPGGPTSSSYARGPDGLGAFAELLARSGHPVDRLRQTPGQVELDAGATVVLLDPPFVSRDDAVALRGFVERGGRLVAGGSNAGWLAYVLERAPRPAPFGGDDLAVPLAPAPEVVSVRRVPTAGEGGWETTGEALPLLGGPTTALLAVARIGRGTAFLLADPSPLQNRLLGAGDNPSLALALAGASRRPVVFLESYHGYGHGRGFGAVPLRWWLLLGGLALAALTFMVARGRRLGPPELEGRPLAPPRREYVDAVAGILERTHQRAESAAPVRNAATSPRAARAGLPTDAGDAAIRHAAGELGLPADEASAIVDGMASDADVLAAGRALARLESTRRRA